MLPKHAQGSGGGHMEVISAPSEIDSLRYSVSTASTRRGGVHATRQTACVTLEAGVQTDIQHEHGSITPSEAVVAHSQTFPDAQNGGIEDSVAKQTSTESSRSAGRPPRPAVKGAPTIRLNSRQRVHRHFKVTPKSTWNELIKDLLWKTNARGSGCCAMHVTLFVLLRRVQDCIAQDCKPHIFHDINQSAYLQCPECFAIQEAEEDGLDSVMCDACMGEIPLRNRSLHDKASSSDLADGEGS